MSQGPQTRRSIMSTPLSRLEEVSRSSRKGSVALQMSSLISEVVELDRTVDQIARYLECLASSKGGCTELNGTSLCSASCGDAFYMRDGSSLKIWKVGGNALSVVKEPGAFLVSTKSFSLQVDQSSYRARIWGNVISGQLEADQLSKDSQLLLQAARKLLPKVKALLDTLSQCARSQGLKC